MRAAAFVIALLGALVFAGPLVPLGLGLRWVVLASLMLVVTALFAAVGAAWTGTLLARDRTRTRLLPVVGVSVGTAAVLAASIAVLSLVLYLVSSGGGYGTSLMGVLVPVFLAGVLIVALSTSWATGRFRGSRTRMGWDAVLTLVLAIVVVVVSNELLSTALVGGSVLGLLFYLPIDVFSYIGPLALVLWLSAASVALSAALAMWRFRRHGDWPGVDAAITLGLVGLVPLVVMGVLYVAELFGLVGA